MGLVVCLGSAAPYASAQYEGLLINEYMARPNLGTTGPHFDSNNDGVNNNFDDEFVEILNTAASAVDIAGCQLFDAIRVRHVFSSRVIPPGGSIVVFGGGDLLNFTNPPAQLATAGTLSLNDTGPESIILYDPLTQEVSRVDYTAAQPPAASMTRYPDVTGGFTNHLLVTGNAIRGSPGRAVQGQGYLTNHPPVIVEIGNKTAFVGLLLAFPVHAYDPADQDPITLSATGQPTNATFSATGGVGVFSFTPNAGQAGLIFNVSFVAADVDGAETNAITVSVVNPVTEETVWINEIHYDNTGDDVDEGVEIAGTAGTVLTNYSIILYNGVNGLSYNTRVLEGTIDDEQCGFGAVWFGYPLNGLQNDVDGIALVKGTNVVQFLSYENSFVAANGPATGMTSTDIGVEESGSTPIGYSLQLVGTGNQYSAFTWISPTPHSRGLLNTGQVITCISPAAILIEKTVYAGHDGGASAPGQETVQGTNDTPVTYVFVVLNTGGSILTNVVITDDSLGIAPIDAGTLQPGAAYTTYVESVIADDLRNTATVTGYDPQGQPVGDSDTAEVIRIIPAVSLQKTVYAGHDDGAACPGGKVLYGEPGTPITYCFQVSNNGNTNLTDVTITDASLGIAPINLGTLLAGQQVFASVTSSINGSLTNEASVSGLDPLSNAVNDADSAVVIAINPAIEIQKTVYLGQDDGASCPGGEFVQGTNGTLVTYCFQVINAGDTILTNVTLSDPSLGLLLPLGTLSTGQMESSYAHHLITASLTNAATASGYAPGGELVMDNDSAEVEITIIPPSSECTFEVTDLGTLGGSMSKAYAINDQGHVVGESTLSNGQTRAFIWKNGVMSNLFERAGLTNSVAKDINLHGHVGGRANDATGAMRGFVFFSSDAISNISPFAGGNYSDVQAINDKGNAVGLAHTLTGGAGVQPHPYLWTNGMPQDLGTFSGYSNHGWSGHAYAINNATQVAGNAHTYVGLGSGRWPAFLWFDKNGNGGRGEGEGDEMIYLAALGGHAGIGNDINNLGQIVGGGPFPLLWGPYRAFVLTPDNGVWFRDSDGDGVNDLLVNLGLMGGTWSEAHAINDSGLAVGFFTSNSVNRAFIYDGQNVQDLNALLCTNSGWVLHEALAVNNSGQIVGYGTYNGQTRAFLLTAGAAIGSGNVEITRLIFGNSDPRDHTIIWRGFGSSLSYTLEAGSTVTAATWSPVAPAGQWPISATYWRNDKETNQPARFYRVRSHMPP